MLYIIKSIKKNRYTYNIVHTKLFYIHVRKFIFEHKILKKNLLQFNNKNKFELFAHILVQANISQSKTFINVDELIKKTQQAWEYFFSFQRFSLALIHRLYSKLYIFGIEF